MFFYLVPLLHKKPGKMILRTGTNDSPFYSATDIVERIGKLKQNILEQLPTVKLVISTPTLRTDKTHANLINAEATKLLRTNEEKIINDRGEGFLEWILLISAVVSSYLLYTLYSI